MQGLMMDTPLTLAPFMERARRLFPGKPLVTRAGPTLRRETYAEWAARAARLAGGLERLGVRRGARVATFAWNDTRHLELYLRKHHVTGPELTVQAIVGARPTRAGVDPTTSSSIELRTTTSAA